MTKAYHRYSRQLDQAAKNLSDAKMPNWDTFKGISRALEQTRKIHASAVDKGPLWWLSSEPTIWNVISALSRTKEKEWVCIFLYLYGMYVKDSSSEQWADDVLSLAQAVLQLGREEGEEKYMRNTVLNLKNMEVRHQYRVLQDTGLFHTVATYLFKFQISPCRHRPRIGSFKRAYKRRQILSREARYIHPNRIGV